MEASHEPPTISVADGASEAAHSQRALRTAERSEAPPTTGFQQAVGADRRWASGWPCPLLIVRFEMEALQHVVDHRC